MGEDGGAAPHGAAVADGGPGPSGAVILVAGDATVDWMLIAPAGMESGLERAYRWEAQTRVHLAAQAGGAAFLAALLAATCGEAAAPVVSAVPIPPASLTDPDDAAFARTYTVWQPYPARLGTDGVAWRMHEFLGQRPAESAPPAPARTAAPACLAIDDTNFGFRATPEAWPACVTDGISPPAHIVLKMANPLANGPLWERLMADHADRLTLYCSLGDLRKEFAPVGQPLSWERTSRDIVKAVGARAEMRRAARVIVSVGMAGAVIIERDGPVTLVFDPLHQEGDWERTRPGIPSGLGTCLLASLALAATEEIVDWAGAARHGLAAARAVHAHGLAVGEGTDATLHFPFAVGGEALRAVEGDAAFRAVAVPDEDEWTVFDTAFARDYRSVATRIAFEGDAEAVKGLPVERMGAWASVDRTEIESMRSVRNIIGEYLSQSRRTRPLSLAVFGPPGAGKSFAIKQMAREWTTGGTTMAVLEFNLSQFATPATLPAALQRVRDCAVEGALPLVFWDEFDSTMDGRPLAWLAPFLAPMQDGAFVEGGVVRPIGPAIFIFAGGTHATMESFKMRAVEVPGAKATDFLSRLRGYVDVLGPNPMADGDETYMLRRALLLRALVRGRAPQMLTRGRLDIDPGVLRAFLGVGTYLHGARSMESVIEMSALAGKARYERSALPARHQLSLHVDADEFIRLVETEQAG
jgi:hypothetical protein